jgi:dUTP pyrophosphatase
MKLHIKLLDEKAKVPNYAHKGDAGFDLFSISKVVVKKHGRAEIKTGIAMKIPKGHVGLIWDKSGVAIKFGIKTMGGVVDSGYRGEIIVGVYNASDQDYIFEEGHKVAQMLIQSVENPQIKIVKELDSTSRGTKGFGSTGK